MTAPWEKNSVKSEFRELRLARRLRQSPFDPSAEKVKNRPDDSQSAERGYYDQRHVTEHIFISTGGPRTVYGAPRFGLLGRLRADTPSPVKLAAVTSGSKRLGRPGRSLLGREDTRQFGRQRRDPPL